MGEVHTAFWCINLKERDHRGNLGVDGNIKMDLREIGYGGVEWIDLAQDRDRKPALLDPVGTFRVPQIVGGFHDCQILKKKAVSCS